MERDLTTVKELLGHKTLQMTMRYAHLSQPHKKRAVDTLMRYAPESEANKKRAPIAVNDRSPQPTDKYGEPLGIRTPDPLIKSQLLYQLS
jgi:hypothetical protein